MTASAPSPDDVSPPVSAEAPRPPETAGASASTTPAETAPHSNEEPSVLTPRLLVNAALLGVLVLAATPAVLHAIVPYWWLLLTGISAAIMTAWGVVMFVAKKAATATFRRHLLDGPRSTRNVLAVIAVCAVACGALYLYLPLPNAPFLRIIVLNDIQWDLLHGSVLQATLTDPEGKTESFVLEMDKAEAWYIGWPEARLDWVEGKQGGRHAAITADVLSLVTVRPDLLRSDNQEREVAVFAKRWQKAKTLARELPVGTSVRLALGRNGPGGFAASPRKVICLDAAGVSHDSFVIGPPGAQTAFAGRAQ